MFKVGDKIKCINDGQAYGGLEKNEIYMVTGTHFKFDEIYINYGSISWNTQRFELVDSSVKDGIDNFLHNISGIEEIKLGVPQKMLVTENENLAYFDVDETLIEWYETINPRAFIYRADFYGTAKEFTKHYKHINFLKSLKARGYYIIVHSGNGWQWAKNVVEALELTDFVDEVKSKPTKMIDDKDYSDWMPNRIYLDKSK